MRIPNVLPSTQVSDWVTGGATVFSVPSRPTLAGPAALPGLVGYWDARDLPSGAVATWSPRAGSVNAGTFTGSGTKSNDYVTSPRFHGTSTAPTLGVTNTSAKSMFVIGSVANLGSDVTSNSIMVLSNAAGAANGPGIMWYNYSGNVMKIMDGAGIGNTAAGIAQKAINNRYLWIVNYNVGSTSATMYTYLENGTGNTTVAPTGDTTAVLHVGTNYNNQSNVVLTGYICAFGLFSQQVDAAGISSLRLWANSDFGVVS